eukprot:GHVU01016673.1.p1 GENE.GHVU01016673.1~~GHVU01016673.1.p1  ORF type:complete len:121 (-),score=4.20 GHVU01016673.1:712-1074(-)
MDFTNVVTHQPGQMSGHPLIQPAPQNQRHFSTGLFDCSDIGTCVYGYFCHWCHMCSVAERLEEHCCTTLHVSSRVALRTKLRTMYGITGTVCDDCMMMTCCGPFAVCQMDRELKMLQGRE